MVWMFKATDGQNRWVQEGGLGLEVLLHLEEFSSWLQWPSTGEGVLSLKAKDAWDTKWFHLLTLVQRGGWLGPELQPAKRDSSKLNRSLPWWWSLFRDEPGHQEAGEAQTHSSRWGAPWGCYLPWVPLDLLAPAPLSRFGLTWLISLTGEKFFSFGWLGLPPLPPTTLALYGLAQRHFSHKVDQWWWSLLGQGCQVLCSGRQAILGEFAERCSIHASKGCLTLNFHGKLFERAGKVAIEHRVWTVAHYLNRTKDLPTASLKD